MTTPLFSTYRQPEDRVTFTFLAVLQRLSLPNIDRILGALLGEDSFRLVSFDNQPQGEKSRPDARIGTGDTVWIETKTQRNAVRLTQIKNHMASLRSGDSLLLLTPDDRRPEGLEGSVVWSNFTTLSDVVGRILSEGDDSEPPSEKEAFLLRELVSMLRKEGLLRSAEPKVVVVGASSAWPMYQTVHAYRCSPSLRFRDYDQFDRMAFYARGEILPIVPKVKAVIESIDLTRQEEVTSLDSPEKEFADELLKGIGDSERHRWFHGNFNVMFLSKPGDDETVDLGKPIVNDKIGKHGKTVPFTYGKPRYVTLESLRKASTTTELEKLEQGQG